MSSMPLAHNWSPRAGWVATLALVTGTLIAAGCAGTPTPSPSDRGASLQPQLLVHSDGHVSTLTIRDLTGLVTGYADGAPLEVFRGFTGVAVANVPNEPRRLGVAWMALPCEAHPSLLIFAEGGRLWMILDRGPRNAPDCDAIGLGYRVTLEFAVSVAAQSVDIQAVSRSSPG